MDMLSCADRSQRCSDAPDGAEAEAGVAGTGVGRLAFALLVIAAIFTALELATCARSLDNQAAAQGGEQQ